MLAVPPVRLMPAPAPRLAAPGPAAALPDGAGVPQPTFLGTPCATEHVRRSRAAGTRLSRGRPGPRASADVPAPRAPGASGTGPRRNHDDGASPWSGQQRWSIAVVTVPAPATGTRTSAPPAPFDPRSRHSPQKSYTHATGPVGLFSIGAAELYLESRMSRRVLASQQNLGPGRGRGLGLGGAGAWAGPGLGPGLGPGVGPGWGLTSVAGGRVMTGGGPWCGCGDWVLSGRTGRWGGTFSAERVGGGQGRRGEQEAGEDAANRRLERMSAGSSRMRSSLVRLSSGSAASR
jgi:hypothetical protein